MARLTALLAQFAADPLRCGEAEMLSADELARLAAVNDTAVLPATTLQRDGNDPQRGRPRMRRRWRTPAGSSAIARCVSRWWRSRSAASARREAWGQRGGWPCRARCS